MRYGIVCVLALGAMPMVGCGEDVSGADASCDGPAPDIGETVVTIQHEGRERAYLLYVPTGYRHDEATPLLLNFHGSGSTASEQRLFSLMDRPADSRTVLLAYPEGLPLDDGGQVFDAGLRDFSSAPRDDVDFARAIVEDVAGRACVDQRRVYSTGMSNGARMSYRIACEAADLVAAIGPVAGVLSLEPEDCQPLRPVPAIHFHGTADAVAPYDRAGGFSTMSVPDMFALWAEKTECTDVPVVSFEKDDVGCQSYETCAGGAEVTLCTIEGAGHCWPGNPTCPLGSSTETINAGEAMLDFMLRFSLNQ
jgi:polyhydroxybutyrate depolymerase